MTSLYLRLAAYLLGAAIFTATGWHMGGLAPKKALAQLQAQDWQGKAQAAAVALTATQQQLKTLQDTIDRNAGIIQGLNDENTKIAADRDANLELAHRLLNSAARAASSSGAPVQKAPGGSAAAAASGAGSDGEAAGLLADAAGECERNADRLDALIAEVKPQL
jgi:TolA-binding protein